MSENTAISTMSEWEQQLADAASSEMDKESGSAGVQISLKNKTFTMGDIDLGDTINVVVGASNFEHSFYDTPYDPDNFSPPACFAIGGKENELAPHPDSPRPQAPSCSECSFNEFGSALVGKGKRCRGGRRLAVYAYGEEGLSMEQTPMIRLAPTSLKSYANYVKGIAARFKRPAYGVVTTLSFDKKQTYPVVLPTFNKLIDTPEEMAMIVNNMDVAFSILAEPFDVEGYEEPDNAPSAVATGGKKSKMS